ncbi:HAD family hydrolase [Danxiaibacter flavus]|uniref:HAD family hydrolase n=1 Tax=Danxiaibacter flavus TaxID=3049108 RepID=A0ABV3ZL63_9BACT|nr:HAD family hydrolase [Chitinophagaceae bacterium DXS]
MQKRALIFDLDNTIYAVRSIGDKIFAPLLELIAADDEQSLQMDKIRHEIMRRPFQMVAKDFNFSEELTSKGIELLSSIRFDGEIEPFSDYEIARTLPLDKFLVTTGFTNMQQSKVTGMNLDRDFKEIHIIDPSSSTKTKKDVFEDIIKRHNYASPEVLVIGDDLHSEIKAALELGISAVLYDKMNVYENDIPVPRITDFAELADYLG